MSVRFVALLLALAPLTTACSRWTEPLRPGDTSWQRLAAARTPLADTAFRVRWDANTIPPVMPRGSETDVRISFTNLGDGVWPDTLSADPGTRAGAFAVRLAYDWSPADAGTSPPPAHRADLPRPVRPGETMTLLVHVVAPPVPGNYRLELALLQELVAWFHVKGAPDLRVPVTVS